jgi:hypothetical protein
MAIAYYAGNRWTGTSSDRASVNTGNIVAGLTFLETNTDDLYQWDGDSWNVIAGNTVVQTLDNKTLTSPVLTTPQINDTSADHQFVFAVTELAADRTVTLPQLGAGDTFTFEAHTQTLTNKTINSANNTISNIVNADLSGTAGITNANLANSTITIAAESGSNDGIALGETFTFTAGEGINTTMGSNAVTIAGEDASVSNKGVASFSSNDFSVSSGAVTIKSGGVTNDQLAGSIANGKLSGPSLIISDGSNTSNVALGGTLTIAATANETTVAESSGTVTIGLPNDVTITGDLTVNGTTTTVNSTTVTIDDPVFTLGGDTAPGSDDDKDRGIEFRYHNGSAAKVGFFGLDDSDSRFKFFIDATNSSEVFSGTVGDAEFTNIYGTLGTAAQANITSVGTLASITVTGASTLNGNVDLGDATSDTITATGRFDSDLVPSSDGARDLGTSLLEWQDLHLDGTANIDTLTADAGTVGGADIVTVSANQTLTTKTLTSPRIGTSVLDTSGNELLLLTATGSAVNELTIANGATGNPASITASGETNIGIKLAGKGTAGVTISNATANGAFLEFDTKVADSTFSGMGVETARLYLKQVDANNNALAVKIQKAGAMVEVQLTSPGAICGVCGGRDGAKDPTYDFARSMMLLELYCGHSYEVPMTDWKRVA